MSPRAWFRGLPLAALFAGCTVGPDYVRPETALPAAFAEGAGEPASGGIAADWWQGFGDPELTRLVGRALAANTDLRVAVGRWEEASAQLSDVAGAAWPAIDATGEADRFKVSRNRTMQRTHTMIVPLLLQAIWN
jgi:outer membrane protein TolC